MQQTNNTQKYFYIHICLNSIQIRHNKPFQDIYFSFVVQDKFYFSSSISSTTSNINDDFFIHCPTQLDIPQIIKLQRWQNKMILFQHQIQITQLKARGHTKKKIQTKQNQFISLSINLYNHQQMMFSDKQIPFIAQHYLSIYRFSIDGLQGQWDDGYSSIIICTQSQQYKLPITNSQFTIQIPSKIQISYYKNDKLYGKSEQIDSIELKQKISALNLYDDNQNFISKIKLYSEWGSNLSAKKIQSKVLYEAHQLCIYDVEVKLEHFAEFAGAKLKFIYGSKSFQLNGELNHRIVQFQRIIFIILKTADQQVLVHCQRNNKVIGEARFNTADLIGNRIQLVKKNFVDTVSQRVLGYIKFTCQKGKNLSLPSSNSFWRQCNKKKISSKIILQIDQLSINCKQIQHVTGIIKTQKQQFKLQPIINFEFFQLQTYVHQPLVLNLQLNSWIYIVMKQKEKQKLAQQMNKQTNNDNQFIGIAELNYDMLRLGANTINIPFYKNHIETLQANCIINKVVPFPFVKGVYQPQVSYSSHIKSTSIFAKLLKVQFFSYYLTYKYQLKNEVYCILQIGKIKKVMIFHLNNQHDMTFNVANGSDNLNFSINQSDFIKAKMTFLVSQNGKQQEIYGFTVFRLRASKFKQQEGQKFLDLSIINDYDICVGNVSLQFKKGQTVHQSQKMSNKDIKRIQNDMLRVNQTIQKMEKNISRSKSKTIANQSQQSSAQSLPKQNGNRNRKAYKRQFPVRYISKRKYQAKNIKLPKI